MRLDGERSWHESQLICESFGSEKFREFRDVRVFRNLGTLSSTAARSKSDLSSRPHPTAALLTVLDALCRWKGPS